MKIVMLDKKTLGYDSDLSELEKQGELVIYETTSEDEVIERIQDADAVIINKVVIGKREMDAAPRLKYIGITATGTNNVDLAYAAKKGITVTNVKGYSTKVVAQHTVALLLSVMEQVAYYDRYIKSGEYSRGSLFTYLEKSFMELDGHTWGIIGLGEIGREVAGLAKAFGCRVIYYSTSGKNNNSEYERVDFDTLLKESDIVSVHAPLTEATHNLMNKDVFSKMKNTAFFINVGRGPIVDEKALADAIDNGEIAGAGLDVFVKEPLSADNPLMNIADKDKIVMTPHIAWASREARARLVMEVTENLKAYTMGEKRNVVNPLQ